MPTTDFDMLTGEAIDAENSLVGIPYAHEYLGAWAITPEAFDGLFSWFQRTDLHLHVAQNAEQVKASARDGGLYGVTKDGVAVIELNGTLMKQVSSMSRGTSTVLARRQIRAAMRDPEVSAILLKLDSPGGTAAGTQELADEVAAAKKEKPVYAFIEDLGASAAYWVASQATKVFTNATGIVGSIGTYMTVMDLSGMAAKEGIKVHVIRAGEMKGAGTPGTEVTAAQLAEWQKTVDGLNDHFVRGVAAGRGLTLAQAKALADGRVYVGKAALEAGLVDGVQTLDATLSQLTSISTRRSKTMSQTTETPANATPAKPGPATYHELKAALVGADAAFITSQLDANATVAQATSAWMTEQNKRVEAANEKAKKAEAGKGPGVRPLSTKPLEAGQEEVEGNAVEQFNAAVAKIAGADPSMERRQNAIAAVARKNPALHKAFLLETNSSRKAHRQLDEKYEDAAV